MLQFNAPAVPAVLASLSNWLVWRLVHKDGQKKPSKIPYYINGAPRPGTQGTPEDRAQLVTLEEAVACVQRSASWERPYTGIGFAPMADSNVVALDFDDCVVDGVIAPHVEALCDGTYTEFSPSGNGVRAFFLGTLLSKKDVPPNMRGAWPIEVFGHNGFVTVTGHVTPTCEMFGWSDAVQCTPAVYEMYRSRGWDTSARSEMADLDADGRALMTLAPTQGLTKEEIAGWLAKLPTDFDYDTWVGVGQSVHQETHGSEEGFALWDTWSRGSPKYTTEQYGRQRWDSFGRHMGAQRTFASVMKLAQESEARAKYKAVAEWKERVKLCTDEFTLREKLCAQVRRDPLLDDPARESLAYLLQSTLKDLGTKLGIAECREMVTPAPAAKVHTVNTHRPLSEFGNADRMLDLYGSELMFVPELDAWYCWTGIYWRKATEVEIEFRAKETIRKLPAEAAQHNETQEFFAFCTISQGARMVRNMVTLAASDPRVMVPARELDKHAHLMGVQNGVVDLRTGQLLPADREHRITKVCGCEYSPDAQAPLWQQTVGDVFFGDAEIIDYFHRAIGYSAMGRPNEDLLFIPFGNGSNGKSTVLGTIRRAFGNYARTADAASFVTDAKGGGSAGGAREDLLRLKGSRFVYVNEPDENGELREGAVKSMTGGDAITARGLYSKDSVEIIPSWVVFMPTNHKPIVKGNDNGIWRRLVLLPFTRNFEGDATVAKDAKREDKLAGELPGVLAWIVRGAMLYQRQGLGAPRSVVAARESYRSQMDLLAEWLEDCCDMAPDLSEESSRLWASWEQFAKSRGIINYVRSSVALGRRLDSRFPASKGPRGVRLRSGLRIKSEWPLVDEKSVAGVAGEALFS